MRQAALIGELVHGSVRIHGCVSVFGGDELCGAASHRNPILVILTKDSSVLVVAQALVRPKGIEVELQAIRSSHRSLPVIAVMSVGPRVIRLGFSDHQFCGRRLGLL
ncbi:hypothetical protein AQI70_06335 [Streptomyces curacoi]|uniref:Uncharacterized protein n=1 Tax=Streptomyces curacoi TaxID=146536 RepID=A0A117PHM6_9ACTN|nr:hypothetical protein AQI70_06335 [Streptomyces curacoi]